MLGADFHKKLSTEPRRRYGEVDDLVDSTTLEECTEPYSGAPTSMRFEEHLLRKWSADLAERRLLVVYSHSQRVIQNVHLALMASSRFDGVSARRLKTEYARKIGSFGYCLARSTSDNETLVLAEARDDYGTQRFMDDLFADSALNWTAHTQRLERQKRCLIVLTTNDHVLRYRGNRGMIPVAEVPFEFALISELEPDDVRAAQLAEQFVRRSSAGVFGASRADQAESLEKLVEDRTFLQALEGAIRAPETRVSLGDNPLEDAVQFVAAFFPKISVADFQELVLLLVGDATEPLVTAVPVAKPEDRASTSDLPRTTLADRFRTSNHRILKDIGLHVVTESSLTTQYPTVAFKDSRTRNLVSEGFASEHHFSFLAMFGKLRQAGVLFHQSDAVVSAVVRLAAAQMLKSPHRYGVQWIVELLLAAGERIDGVQIEVKAAEEMAKAGALIAGLQAQQHQHHLILERLEILIRAMLEHPTLQRTIQEAGEQLCSAGQFGIVLNLAARLDRAPDLDVLSWLRRVIDEGHDTDRVRASRQLQSLGCRPSALSSADTPSGAARVLLELRGWATEGAKERPSRRVAFEVMVRIGEHALGASPFLGEDERSRRRPGLLEWVNQPSTTVPQVDEFVGWLVSAETESLLEDTDDALLELGHALFYCWYRPLGRWLPDEGESLGSELADIWQGALNRAVRLHPEPTATLFLSIVFADCVQRSEAEATGVTLLTSAINRCARRGQLRAWRVLLQAHVASTQKVRRALQLAEPKLSKQQRVTCSQLRTRAQLLDQIWRGFSDGLKESSS